VRNPRGRITAGRRRPLWLEVSGQRRLQRLYARQQLRRQLLRRWSELSRQNAMRRFYQPTNRGTWSDYDAGHGDLSAPAQEQLAAPGVRAEVGLASRLGEAAEGQPHDLPDRWPVSAGPARCPKEPSGYDAASWDIVGS
jgi:hypothetical protein